MKENYCKYRVVEKEGAAVVGSIAGSGGLCSNSLCLLLIEDGNPFPFCKAPDATTESCPVAKFFRGEIAYEKAEKELEALPRTPRPNTRQENKLEIRLRQT